MYHMCIYVLSFVCKVIQNDNCYPKRSFSDIIVQLFCIDHFLKVIKRANEEPVKKYTKPQTEAQEIGWITKPLVGLKTFRLSS